jgi:hemolysin activation/secretion protein
MTVSEQFALGGPDSVRGYIQSEGLFDDGYSTSLEYRQLVYTSEDKKINVQVAGFLDHGDGSLQRAQVGERESRSLTGIGLGTRASIGRTTSIRVDIGHPLTDMNQLNKEFILYAQTVSRW